MLGQSEKLTVSGPRDARVAAIAACQRGRVARRQLLTAGLGSGQVDWLVHRGRLFPQHLGVYAVGHPGPVPLGAETAALLAVPAGALLSCRSAGPLWELEGIEPLPGIVEVLVDPATTVRRAGIRAHRSRFRASCESRIREGLPVCPPALVLLDLAVDLAPRALSRAHDQALVSGVLRPWELAEIVARMPGHPGCPHVRPLLVEERGPGLTRSEAEARLLELIRDADLPRPRVNQRVHGYEVDLHWPEAKLVVEVDGYRFHSTRAAFERDRIRDARLQAASIEVLRVTWRQLEHEPLAVVARIAAALARRTARA